MRMAPCPAATTKRSPFASRSVPGRAVAGAGLSAIVVLHQQQAVTADRWSTPAAMAASPRTWLCSSCAERHQKMGESSLVSRSA